MKKNLKLNLSWLAIIVVLLGCIELLTKTNILNLYYIQILMGIGISILMGLGTNLVLGNIIQVSLLLDKLVSWQSVLMQQPLSQQIQHTDSYFSMLVGIVIAVLVTLSLVFQHFV